MTSKQTADGVIEAAFLIADLRDDSFSYGGEIFDFLNDAGMHIMRGWWEQVRDEGHEIPPEIAEFYEIDVTRRRPQ